MPSTKQVPGAQQFGDHCLRARHAGRSDSPSFPTHCPALCACTWPTPRHKRPAHSPVLEPSARCVESRGCHQPSRTLSRGCVSPRPSPPSQRPCELMGATPTLYPGPERAVSGYLCSRASTSPTISFQRNTSLQWGVRASPSGRSGSPQFSYTSASKNRRGNLASLLRRTFWAQTVPWLFDCPGQSLWPPVTIT